MSYKVTWTLAKKEAAIAMLTEFFEKHGVGECIMQSDNATIYAPVVLSDIADSVLIDGEGITYVDEDDFGNDID